MGFYILLIHILVCRFYIRRSKGFNHIYFATFRINFKRDISTNKPYDTINNDTRKLFFDLKER